MLLRLLLLLLLLLLSLLVSSAFSLPPFLPPFASLAYNALLAQKRTHTEIKKKKPTRHLCLFFPLLIFRQSILLLLPPSLPPSLP